MSQATKKTQLHVQRKRKSEAVKSSPLIEVEDEREREAPSKLAKVDIGPDFLVPNRPPLNDQRSEFYPVPQYAQLNDGTEIYARNARESEFPINENGVAFYAKVKMLIDGNEHSVEVPPKTKENLPIYIHNDTGILYPMDLTLKRPVFKKNDDGGEEYLTDSFVITPHYPIDADGKAYYAREANGDEYPIKRDNKCIYAKGKDNKEIYPRKANLDEFALEDENDVPYYAKNEDEHEYYPTKIDGQ